MDLGLSMALAGLRRERNIARLGAAAGRGALITTEKHRLQLMGAFEAAAPLSRKARALLAYLALNADTAVPRERLCGLLWSERGEEQARGSLRQCLQELRPFAAGPYPLLDIGRIEITLWGERVATDLDEIRALSAAGDAAGLAHRLAGEGARLLANLDGLDPAFDEWLTLQRAAIDNQIEAEAMACAKAALAGGAPDASLRLAQAMCARDPLDEAATRLGISAARAAGRPAEAHRLWRRLKEALRRELGAEPSAETAAWYANATDAPPAAPASAAIAAQVNAPRRRPSFGWMAGAASAAVLAMLAILVWRLDQPARLTSLAVQRISAPAGDGAGQMFADRLAGEVASMVGSRATRLKVFQPGEGPSPGFVIGGMARTVGDMVAATVTLYSTRDRSIVWSASYTRPLAQAADLPTQAAAKLADVLTCAVHGEEPAYRDVEVLKLFLIACGTINDPAGHPEQTRDQFLKVVARAPNFARAWGELAMADADILVENQDSPDDRAFFQRAVNEDSGRALRLDPREARAWTARAMATLALADWVRRRADLDRAVALDPDQAAAFRNLGEAWGAIGRERDSLAAEHRAADLDPLSPVEMANLAFDQALAGFPGDAKVTFDSAERRWPGDLNLAAYRLFANARVGDAAAALKALDDPDHPVVVQADRRQYWRLMCLARLDPKRSAQAAAFIRAQAGKDLSLAAAIQGLAAVGHADDALDMVEANIGYFRNYQDQTEVFFRPYMTRFLASPRFMPLAARIGLVDIWRKTGLWPDFCTEDAPYDCKREAAKAMAAPRR